MLFKKKAELASQEKVRIGRIDLYPVSIFKVTVSHFKLTVTSLMKTDKRFQLATVSNPQKAVCPMSLAHFNF